MYSNVDQRIQNALDAIEDYESTNLRVLAREFVMLYRYFFLRRSLLALSFLCASISPDRTVYVSQNTCLDNTYIHCID